MVEKGQEVTKAGKGTGGVIEGGRGGCLFRGTIKRWGDLDLWIVVAGIPQGAKAHGSSYKDDGENNLSYETFPVPAGMVEPLNVGL